MAQSRLVPGFARIRQLSGLIPVYTLDDLSRLCLSMLFVGECVYVCGQAGRGGGIHAGDMMVYANLIQCQSLVLGGLPSGEGKVVAYMLARVASLLLQEVDKIRRTEFAEGDERFGAGIDGLL